MEEKGKPEGVRLLVTAAIGGKVVIMMVTDGFRPPCTAEYLMTRDSGGFTRRTRKLRITGNRVLLGWSVEVLEEESALDLTSQQKSIWSTDQSTEVNG
ncbi:hypothetical protein M8C21_031022 [Ambrosia artemisiifolia]|uniref:Uncharacterized protein n=1 Tax=Ambrosia artemisiifolia TaxID=4212 RepID=A0AAD5CLC5_AMBAR|nr:hypothetical protein M8C21_031022 [Ambrosia artemisiifolia]